MGNEGEVWSGGVCVGGVAVQCVASGGEPKASNQTSFFR